MLLLPLFLLAAPIPSALAAEPASDGLAADDAEETTESGDEAAEPEPEPVAATTYTLNPAAGLIYVRTHKEGVAAAIAHDHVVQATGWSGTVTWHPEDASQCKVEIAVPVSGLVVDQTEIRNGVGVEGEVSESQREEITEHMLDEKQLNVAGFPSITFSSTSCSGTSGAVKVTGNMTIRGTSAPVSVDMNVSADGSSFSAQGAFSTTHSAFGITPFSALFGAIANGEQLDFGIKVQGSAE